jgi:prophage tail gpP-like protein
MSSDRTHDDGELTIEVGGAALSGWQDIDVTLLAEGFPNTFSISLSSKLPIESKATVAKAGDPCAVKIGGDLVITGYIDRDVQEGGAENHSLALIGRGKTQDLVDCSAEWDGGQIKSATALDIATKLAQVYGITVKLAKGAEAGQPVPQTNLTYGETGASIIQRVARNAALLAYENAAGELVLARAGSDRAASGVKYGDNVERFSVSNAMDQRYSDVRVAQNGVYVIGDVTGAAQGKDAFFYFNAPDPNVPRHRLLYILQEEVAYAQEFTILKAKWEVARRAGRAGGLNVTVDSWRDSAGKLWQPNTVLPVDVPGNRAGAELCISEVSFHRSNERGTVADLYLLPASAFAPEPISLQPINTNGLLPGSEPAP